MTVLLGVSMGAHAVRMALPRNGVAFAPEAPSAARVEAPQKLFFKNQVIDTVDEDVEYLAAESISAMAAESEPTMSTGVAYRDAHQADTLHRALEHQHLHNYHLVHEVEAVAEYLIASGEASGFGTVALYDLGSSGLNVSVVDLTTRRVITTRRSTEFSGDAFDRLLRDNQLERLGKPRNAPDIDLFTRRCRVAKERLSGNDAVCLPDASGMILLSRDSYETLITDEVDRSIEFAREVMIGAQVPIDAVVLIGGGSRIPLVRSRVGPSLELPALLPTEPESVAARGAALSARTATVASPLPESQPSADAVASVEEVQAEEVRAEEVRAGEVRAEEVRAEEVRAEEVRAEEVPADVSSVRESALRRPALVGAGAGVVTASVASLAPPAPAHHARPDTESRVRESNGAGPAVTEALARVTPPSGAPPFLPWSPGSDTSDGDADASVDEVSPAPLVPNEPAPSPEDNLEDGPRASPTHFALKNVYWLDADYDDDDGETDAERKRRAVRSWSIVGVAVAAVVAVSGFFLTRPSDGPTLVDTAVNDAPATTAPAATTPSVTVAPAVPPVEELTPPAPETIPETVAEVPEYTPEEQYTPEYTPPQTEEAPSQEVTPEPTAEVPSTTPEPPPLIPGLPDFTLPAFPPLFPPA